MQACKKKPQNYNKENLFLIKKIKQLEKQNLKQIIPNEKEKEIESLKREIESLKTNLMTYKTHNGVVKRRSKIYDQKYRKLAQKSISNFEHNVEIVNYLNEIKELTAKN